MIRTVKHRYYQDGQLVETDMVVRQTSKVLTSSVTVASMAIDSYGLVGPHINVSVTLERNIGSSDSEIEEVTARLFSRTDLSCLNDLERYPGFEAYAIRYRGDKDIEAKKLWVDIGTAFDYLESLDSTMVPLTFEEVWKVYKHSPKDDWAPVNEVTFVVSGPDLAKQEVTVPAGVETKDELGTSILKRLYTAKTDKTTHIPNSVWNIYRSA